MVDVQNVLRVPFLRDVNVVTEGCLSWSREPIMSVPLRMFLYKLNKLYMFI